MRDRVRVEGLPRGTGRYARRRKEAIRVPLAGRKTLAKPPERYFHYPHM